MAPPQDGEDASQDEPHFAVQLMMQAYTPDDVPFLCIVGVHEYHHLLHSGDLWLPHGRGGRGRLIT